MSPASNPAPDPDLAGYVPPTLPPETRRALRVLVAHFPELLKKHQRKWVACDGNGVLFVGRSWDAVYNRCLKRGLKPEEFVLEYVLPGGLHDLDMDSLRDPA